MCSENEERNHEYGKGSDKSGILERDSRIGERALVPSAMVGCAVNDWDTAVMFPLEQARVQIVEQVSLFITTPTLFFASRE